MVLGEFVGWILVELRFKYDEKSVAWLSCCDLTSKRKVMEEEHNDVEWESSHYMYSEIHPTPL